MMAWSHRSECRAHTRTPRPSMPDRISGLVGTVTSHKVTETNPAPVRCVQRRRTLYGFQVAHPYRRFVEIRPCRPSCCPTIEDIDWSIDEHPGIRGVCRSRCIGESETRRNGGYMVSRHASRACVGCLTLGLVDRLSKADTGSRRSPDAYVSLMT